MNAKGRSTLDTNILFYASDNTVPHKRDRAQLLIRAVAAQDSILTLQSLAELFNAFGKRRVLSHTAAEEIVLTYREIFTVVSAAETDLADAILAQQEHNLPFWDAMLWATARRAGCSLFFTEDFQDGRTLGGVTFRNPFNLSQTQLDELLD